MVVKAEHSGTNKKSRLVFSGVLLVLLVLLAVLGANAGHYLIKAEEPEKADVIAARTGYCMLLISIQKAMLIRY